MILCCGTFPVLCFTTCFLAVWAGYKELRTLKDVEVARNQLGAYVALRVG